MAAISATETVLVANGAGFLGDHPAPPAQLAACAEFAEERPAYLTLEYLAELTLSILARRRQRDPHEGYAHDFLDALAEIIETLRQRPHVRLVTNAGGVNPPACVRRAAERLVQANLGEWKLACVTGDDLLPRLTELQAEGVEFRNLETGEPLREVPGPIVAAHAYLGARPIAESLAQGARLVVTGRVADASLTLGPAVHEFGWDWDDYHRLAGASTAGHLIECGAQVTGGYRTQWQAQRLEDIGYPIAEITAEGDCTITKPAGTGGRVDRQVVAEQLVYEIGDPAAYLTPDVSLDLRQVSLRETGSDRVFVSGARGAPPPETLKVSLAWHAGYMAAGHLLVVGRDAVQKAHACSELVFRRMERAGQQPARRWVDFVGANDFAAGPNWERNYGAHEVWLRLAVEDPSRECVERFARELAPLITSGPAGLAGYAAGRPQVRPAFAHWPTLVPRELVEPLVEVRTARQWSETDG